MKFVVAVVACFHSVPLNSIDLIALCVALLLIPDLGTWYLVVVQSQSCPTLCDPMDCSTPGFSVLHHLMELAQTQFH